MSAKGPGSLPLFVILNFCFAASNLFGFLAFGALVVIGVFFSEKNEEGRVEGVTFCLLLMVLFLVCILLYLMAAIGLLRKSVWGYYCHLAGAALAALSCLGLAYSIPAFIVALRPEFQEEFFPSQQRNSIQGRDDY